MRRNIGLGLCSASVVAAAIALGSTQISLGQEEDSQQRSGNPAAAEENDFYTVPEGSPEEILEYLDKLLGRRPPADELEKVIDTAITASTAVLESEKAKPEQAARAATIKLQMLSIASQIRGEDAENRLEAFRQQLRNDQRPAVRAVVIQRDLVEQLGRWATLRESQKSQWVEDFVEYLNSIELETEHGQLISYAAQAIAQQGDTEIAQKLISSTLPIFRQSEDEEFATVADRLEGIARYLSLPGSKMVIKGELLGGEEFDWSQYEDKVVLVDFWATWCGPCIAELPNVKKSYTQYHGKGFEVIGISLDTEAEAVRRFVEQHDIPWPILFSTDEDATGWSHPMAVKYGIQAIPAAILLGRDGKVITLSARGEDLGEHLQELLGEPLPVDDEDKAADSEGSQSLGGR